MNFEHTLLPQNEVKLENIADEKIRNADKKPEITLKKVKNQPKNRFSQTCKL